jgi:hypothetical protein
MERKDIFIGSLSSLSNEELPDDEDDVDDVGDEDDEVFLRVLWNPEMTATDTVDTNADAEKR